MEMSFDRGDAIARGEMTYARARAVLGYNSAVGSNQLDDVTEIGDIVTKYPGGILGDTAVAVEIQSTSANDTAAGSGARTVMVHGLDENWQETEYLVSMDGLTSVAVPGLWARVNNIHVMAVGGNALGVAEGDITCENVGNTEVYRKVAAGGNMDLGCTYTIPAIMADGTPVSWGYMVAWSAGCISSTVATIDRAILRATCDYFDRGLIPGVFHFQDIISGKANGEYRRFALPKRVPPKCDIKVSAQQTQGAGVTEASASIEVYFER